MVDKHFAIRPNNKFDLKSVAVLYLTFSEMPTLKTVSVVFAASLLALTSLPWV